MRTENVRCRGLDYVTTPKMRLMKIIRFSTTHRFVNILRNSKLPNARETVGDYVKRVRLMLGLNQKELAAIAGIHLQSVGKIERGLTAKLSSYSKSGLASALQVPVEYLEAVCRGTPIVISQLKFCAPCWTPGTPPDPLWMEVRAK